MKYFRIGILLACVSCAHTQPVSETRKAEVNTLLLDHSPASNSDHAVTRAKATKDIELLIAILQNGYAGARYLPQYPFLTSLKNLKILEQTLPASISALDLCKKAGNSLQEVPDRHLELSMGKTFCDPVPKPVGNVGPNYSKKTKQAWEQNELIVSQSLSVPVFSIHYFPSEDDSEWVGFQEAIESEIMTSEAIVIDLRGNEGGSDGQGHWLADTLYGGKSPNAYRRIIERQTPEALALFINSLHLDELAYTKDGKEVPESLGKYVHAERDRLKLAFEGNLPEESIQDLPDSGKPFNPLRGYNQKIYILIDRRTGSSAESTLAMLRMHPKAKVIGENTYGAIHFGNPGMIELPESGIVARMGTRYLEDKDGKFYEIVGYSPDVRTPQGEDAMDWVKRDLERKF